MKAKIIDEQTYNKAWLKVIGWVHDARDNETGS
jgi:hypothetical protein